MVPKVKSFIQDINKKLNDFVIRHKWIVLSLYFGIFLIAVYHIYFSNRIIPGVRIGETSIGGMTYYQAKSALSSREASITKKVSIVYGSDIFYIDSADIEFTYDWDATVTRAFEIGRTGNFVTDNKDKLAGLIKGISLSAFYEYDDALFTNKLATIKGEINQETKDAAFALAEDNLVVTPEVIGRKIDGDMLFDAIMSSYNNVDYKEITPKILDENPQVSTSDIESLRGTVEKLVKNPLKIVLGKREWKLDSNQVLELIKPKKEEDGEMVLTLNRSKYDIFLETLSYEVGELPRGKVSYDEDGKVTSFEIIKQGTEINKKEFTERFKDALFNAKPTVDLVLIETTEVPNKEKYGIYSLLGEGVSKYTGSGASRIHNLNLAAERTSGVLVPPGAIYSFNKSVGEISGRTGYDSAYIILGGRTVLGEGGGVCQTSTTLFRAILNAGLPIVTRYPHAYRVVYYELDRPVGFDAAVFQPSLDLQFRNDTPNYVLIQVEPNIKEYRLAFKIFGTPDGRSVEISEPVVTNQTPPPEPLYQDDPTLKKGVKKQIDFAAWGANVSFSRIVKRGEDILYNDTFKSRYQAWRAIYLVGTKE